MNAKECLWAKFRSTCPIPNACQFLDRPNFCTECGWDQDAAWESCLQNLSPIARVVEEIIAEEESQDYYTSGQPPF
jgi:hypothetical protein